MGRIPADFVDGKGGGVVFRYQVSKFVLPWGNSLNIDQLPPSGLYEIFIFIGRGNFKIVLCFQIS